MEIYIGIPCYRVAESIRGVVERIHATGVKAHLLLVNDGSPDDLDATVATLDTSEFLSFTYHKHPQNRGYGGAQKTLFSLFLEKARNPHDLLIFVHGDGQTDESEIIEFIEEARQHPEANFILGSRMLNSPLVQWRAGRPLYKIAGDYLLTAAFNLAFGNSLSTFAIGYRAHTRQGVTKVDLTGMTDAHTFDLEYMIRLGRAKVTCRELCLTVVKNDTGFSANRLSKFMSDCVQLFLRYTLNGNIGKAYLVINADDFGYAKSINDAVLAGLAEGRITSASLMANGAFFEDAVTRACTEGYGDRIGVHVNLSEGRPLGQGYRTLVDRNGALLSISALIRSSFSGSLDPIEVRQEVDLQVAKCIAAGITPSHLDTHQWSQILPEVTLALGIVAQKYHIPYLRTVREKVLWRILLGASPRSLLNAAVISLFRRRVKAFPQPLRTPDHYYGIVLTGHRSFGRSITSIARLLPPGVSELMCHIGSSASGELAGTSYYTVGRYQEYEALGTSTFKDALEERGVTLVSYRELAQL